MYVILIFEGFISLCLCSFSEIGRYKVNDTGPEQNSFYFSVFFATICLFSILIVLIVWTVIKPIQQNMKKFLQKELYEGIRLNKAARLQPILFLVRRAALCLIITLCRSIDRFIFMGIYSFINLVHCLIICCIRPFKNTSENITDVMNEVFLVFFSIFLAFHRLESDWDSTKTAAFYWILVMNNMLNALFSIGIFIYTLCTYKKNPKTRIKNRMIKISPNKIKNAQLNISKCLPRLKKNADLRRYKYRNESFPHGGMNSSVINPSVCHLNKDM